MTRAQIEELDREIQALKDDREARLLELQAGCDHPVDDIFEVDYRDGGILFSATPPFRVCRKCGYAEEGWHCGYWKLDTREEVPTISREKARRDYVLKFYTQEQMNEERFKK